MVPLFRVCADSAAVTSLLGTAPVRLWPFGEAPADTALPYAVWQQITGSPESLLEGGADIDGFTLQVDVYAATPESATAVRNALRDAIEPHGEITRWAGDQRDPVTGRHRAGFDVDWLVPR